MTTTQYLKLAVLALGLIAFLTAVSSGGYQQTQSILIDDNETANASFSSGDSSVIGEEQVYNEDDDGSTVCIGNTACGDEESEDERMAPPGEAAGPPKLDDAPRHFNPGPPGR